MLRFCPTPGLGGRSRARVVAVAATLALAGCGLVGPSSPTAHTPATSATSALSGKLTVFAAASLKTTFTMLGQQFEAANPGTTVRFSFDGSATLVTQIQQGAPVDVFASADTNNMDKLGDAALGRQNFATNTLEIVVPPDNPANITSFADLAKPGIKLVICAPEVPCGAATKQVADAAGLMLNPVSLEQSVTDVLGKVSSGEADAGVVYLTDVKGGGGSVKGIKFPEASGAVNTYPIAVIKGSKNPDLAQAFVAYLLGDSGHQVLADAGFGEP